MNVETTEIPCYWCSADALEPCRTSTGLVADRVHISREGDVVLVEATGPLLADALGRHATDVEKFMKESGL